VLDAKGARIVQSPVADHEKRRQTVGRGNYQRFHTVHPTRAARSAEGAGVNGTGVLDDLELGMLAVGDNVLGVEFPVGDQLREGVHHLGVGTYRISGDHIHVGETYALCDGLAAV
jgi:hypothetical protein